MFYWPIISSILIHSRAVGMWWRSMLRMVAEYWPELFADHIRRILYWQGSTFCNDLGRSVWPDHARKARFLKDGFVIVNCVMPQYINYLPPLFNLSDLLCKTYFLAGHCVYKKWSRVYNVNVSLRVGHVISGRQLERHISLSSCGMISRIYDIYAVLPPIPVINKPCKTISNNKCQDTTRYLEEAS